MESSKLCSNSKISCRVLLFNSPSLLRGSFDLACSATHERLIRKRFLDLFAK